MNIMKHDKAYIVAITEKEAKSIREYIGKNQSDNHDIENLWIQLAYTLDKDNT